MGVRDELLTETGVVLWVSIVNRNVERNYLRIKSSKSPVMGELPNLFAR